VTTFEIIENIIFYLALYVLLWNAYFLLVNKGIPNIKTAPAIRLEVISRLRAEMAAKKKTGSPFTIIDLGCGNGDFSRQIAREIPEARVIGIEISKLAYARCCLMKRIYGLKNLEYRNEDFRDSEILKEADAVCMFLLGTLMKSIRETLENNLKEGTFVSSNKFPVGGDWEPKEVIDVDTLYPHQKTLYLYHYKGKNLT
jgi:SAM-dependent methyltransferase